MPAASGWPRTNTPTPTTRQGAAMRRARTIAAWILLVGSLIGWPISQLTFARHEPVLTLSLSWLAIVLVAADLLTTSQVAERSGSPEPRKEPRCPERKTTL